MKETMEKELIELEKAYIHGFGNIISSAYMGFELYNDGISEGKRIFCEAIRKMYEEYKKLNGSVPEILKPVQEGIEKLHRIVQSGEINANANETTEILNFIVRRSKEYRSRIEQLKEELRSTYPEYRERIFFSDSDNPERWRKYD